jgi:hypothetical protein
MLEGNLVFMNGETSLFKLEPALVDKLKKILEVDWKAIASLVWGACEILLLSLPIVLIFSVGYKRQ